MPHKNIKDEPTLKLLKDYANILDELKNRQIIRTYNNPVADYAEWLVASKLGMKLERNSKSGYDAIDNEGIKYQIKSRRISDGNRSYQLGVIRNLLNNEFDYLIVLIFDRNFMVESAFKIPHEIIEKYARFSKHQNGHILFMRGDIMRDKNIQNISELVR